MTKGTGDIVSRRSNSTNFYAPRSCERGDITFFFCHVTSRDYMIKGTYDLLSGGPFTYVTTVPSLILYRYYGSGNITILFGHMTLHDYVDQMNKWLDKWEPFILSKHGANFNLYRCYRSKNITFLICHVTSCNHMIKGICDMVSRSLST